MDLTFSSRVWRWHSGGVSIACSYTRESMHVCLWASVYKRFYAKFRASNGTSQA